MKVIIIKECSCEHDLHEITNYPRPGLTVQKFAVGQELIVEKEWHNWYGKYYRCTTDKCYADIAITNAKVIP